MPLATVEVVRKITFKQLVGLTRDVSTEQTKASFLAMANDGTGNDFAVIVGDVSGYTVKPGKFGEEVAFTGAFIGRNNITGVIQKAAKLFVSKGDADLIRGAVDKKGDQGNISINWLISIVPDKGGITGYQFIASPVGTAEVVNRENQMLQAIAQVPLTKQLAAPKKAA